MAIRPGDTFILKRGTGSTPHLRVVSWGPAGEADAYLIVHLTTVRPHTDRTVVMQAGEHPFIQHDTCAVYSDARRTTAEKLNAARHDRMLVPKAGATRRCSRSCATACSVRPALRTPWCGWAIEEFGAVPP
jgi:hypothetical protein